jgi:uncharacterized membrane protein
MQLARNFFNHEEQKLLTDAIAKAELKTSGEIRVHLDNFCFGNELKKAGKTFMKLNMHQTKERNGVLIYIAAFSKKIAVTGDEGIHQKLGDQFWQTMVNDLIQQFKEKRKAQALADCIIKCGEQLGKYFPRDAADKNELSNEISF